MRISNLIVGASGISAFLLSTLPLFLAGCDAIKDDQELGEIDFTVPFEAAYQNITIKGVTITADSRNGEPISDLEVFIAEVAVDAASIEQPEPGIIAGIYDLTFQDSGLSNLFIRVEDASGTVRSENLTIEVESTSKYDVIVKDVVETDFLIDENGTVELKISGGDIAGKQFPSHTISLEVIDGSFSFYAPASESNSIVEITHGYSNYVADYSSIVREVSAIVVDHIGAEYLPRRGNRLKLPARDEELVMYLMRIDRPSTLLGGTGNLWNDYVGRSVEFAGGHQSPEFAQMIMEAQGGVIKIPVWGAPDARFPPELITNRDGIDVTREAFNDVLGPTLEGAIGGSVSIEFEFYGSLADNNGEAPADARLVYQFMRTPNGGDGWTNTPDADELTGIISRPLINTPAQGGNTALSVILEEIIEATAIREFRAAGSSLITEGGTYRPEVGEMLRIKYRTGPKGRLRD